MSEKVSKPYVTHEFCDERTARIEQIIKTAKAEIIAEVKEAIKNEHSMSMRTKAAMATSLIMGVSSIIVALITAFM